MLSSRSSDTIILCQPGVTAGQEEQEEEQEEMEETPWT
jgi:hypothetical protein